MADSLFLEIQTILLGDNPFLLYPLLQSNKYIACKINSAKSEQGFAVINRIPNTMLTRWWALLQLTCSDAQAVCSSLGFKDIFYKDLCKVNMLYSLPPADSMPKLKNKLNKLPDFKCEEYIEIIATFALLNTSFKTEQQLFLQLLENDDAFLLKDLAVDYTLLKVNGIPENKIDDILRLLLQAVIKAPQINNAASLLKLAKQFNAIKK